MVAEMSCVGCVPMPMKRDCVPMPMKRDGAIRSGNLAGAEMGVYVDHRHEA